MIGTKTASSRHHGLAVTWRGLGSVARAALALPLLIGTGLAGGGITTAAEAGGGQGFTAPNLDHFKCYRAVKAKGEPKFQERAVTLADQFETKQTRVLKPRDFCNPVDKDGGGILDSTAHLKCYKIKDAKGEPGFQEATAMVENQFGIQTVVVKKAFMLCVPSIKNGRPSNLNLDNFKCYKTKRAKGSKKFTARNVSLTDQFETRQMIAKKPRLLCSPADRDGGGIIDPVGHLQCYLVQRIPKDPKFQPVDVTVDNDWGTENLTVKSPELLCVPSTKTLVP